MNDNWKHPFLPFEKRVEILVSQMTLEEKVSQMTFASPALSRFGIPEYNWWNECLHGVARAGSATMFPQPIGMAASFDDEQLFEIAEIISDEARVKHHAAAAECDRGIYKGLTMWTPNINIFRDPRWGRGHETYGEDPFLTARMGVAFIKGLQGDDKKYFKCIATAKHFAVHSGPEADRHSFDAVVSKKDMAQTYLPAFKAAVTEAKVYSVMGSYNRVNGEAACASPTLLQDILRKEWGFNGYVVSDCGAIEDIYKFHKLVETPAEAAALAVKNGCDLCCGFIYEHLIEAVNSGLIDEEYITKAAYRLLLARFKLGFFDPEDKQPYTNMLYELNDCAAHHARSLQMAQDSLVLLKNDGLLPLDAGAIKTIAVIGPNADSRAALIGNYAGTPSETYTVLEGMRLRLRDTRILYAEGCALTGGSKESAWSEKSTFRIAEALTAARAADVAIVVVGLNGENEGEEGDGSGDRESMLLPESQRTLLESLLTVDTPIVLINMTGSPTIFPHEERYNAIIQAWYPGQMGGVAVSTALFGDYNPSGRLPVTFYASMEQVPDFSDYSMVGRTYRYMDKEPAYPFGFGLSYTEFEYSGIECTYGNNGLDVKVNVRNTGPRYGKEVVQCYIKLLEPQFEGPKYQLAAFKCVRIEPGAESVVCLHIWNDMLGVYDDDGQVYPHKGEIEVYVGGGQPDSRTISLTGKTPLKTRVTLP